MKVEIKGIILELETREEIFSPKGADKGTAAMLSQVDISPYDKVLDLGCGCGIVGIYAAKIAGEENVVLTDISPIAAEIARKNAENNGVGGVRVYVGNAYEQIEDRDFTLILSNPPYHTDFSVAKEFVEEGFNRLVIGGKMIMVTKRLDWYKNKLISVFGGVKITEINGYYVFISEKRAAKRQKSVKDKNKLSKKLARKNMKVTQS